MSLGDFRGGVNSYETEFVDVSVRLRSRRKGYVETPSSHFSPFCLIFLENSVESAFPFLTQRAITLSTPAGRGLPG